MKILLKQKSEFPNIFLLTSLSVGSSFGLWTKWNKSTELPLVAKFLPNTAECVCSPPNTKGDICWSGKRLFSEGDNSTIRQTLFIRKNVDGTRDLAVFDSEFEYYRKEDKMYVYKAINKPKILINAPCKVHLMSNSNDKLKALELVLNKGT